MQAVSTTCRKKGWEGATFPLRHTTKSLMTPMKLKAAIQHEHKKAAQITLVFVRSGSSKGMTSLGPVYLQLTCCLSSATEGNKVCRTHLAMSVPKGTGRFPATADKTCFGGGFGDAFSLRRVLRVANDLLGVEGLELSLLMPLRLPRAAFCCAEEEEEMELFTVESPMKPSLVMGVLIIVVTVDRCTWRRFFIADQKRNRSNHATSSSPSESLAEGDVVPPRRPSIG